MTESVAGLTDHPQGFPALRRRDVIPSVFAFTVSFSVYLFTLAPTITFGDSGELITAAVTLGIAHPPGYPLWLILAKLFSFLPIGSVAYRLNLMSAILDSMAVGLVALVIAKTLPGICRRVISREAFESPAAAMMTASAAGAAALVLAFSPVFWEQSVIAEVYALQHLIIGLILLCLVLWGEASQRNGPLYAAAFLFGAGLANHQTLLLMAPAIALYVILIRPRVLLSPRAWFGCFVLFLLGISFYLYLPIRASAHPPLNWGDPSSWNAFWFHVARKQYRVIEVIRPLSVLLPQLKFFFASVPNESFPVVLLLPALLAFGFSDKGGKWWLLFTLAAFICTGVIFIIIANTELDLNAQTILKVYFLPSFMIVTLWVGYGIGIIGLLALRASRRLRLRVMPATILAVLWLLLPVSTFLLNYHKASMRGRDFGHVYGEMLMNGLREGAILLVGTDSAYSIPMYMKWVRGRRPDVSILNVNRLVSKDYAAEAEVNAPDIDFLTPEDYIEAVDATSDVSVDSSGVYGSRKITRVNGYLMWKLLQRNASEKPVYYDEGVPVEWVTDHALPSGLVMELKLERIPSLSANVVAFDTDFWNSLEDRLLRNKKFLDSAEARTKFSKCRSNIAALYFHRGMYAEAEAALMQAIRFSDMNIEAYALLALMYQEQGRHDDAIRVFGEYLKRDPWNTSAKGFAATLRQE